MEYWVNYSFYSGREILNKCLYTVVLIKNFSEFSSSSRYATLGAVIQDYATLRNNNAVEALIDYN